MNRITRVASRVADVAGCAVTAVVWGTWFVVDHLHRRFTGRRSLMDETLSDLAFGIDARDLEKPYDNPGSSAPEERAAQISDPERPAENRKRRR
jgi:hypothetical protein